MHSADSIRTLSGFGRAHTAEAYVYRPTCVDEVARLFDAARQGGRQLALRGAGRSYGDAAYLREEGVVDFSDFNRVLDWDPQSGLLRAEPGVTLEDLWRRGLPDGWWPAVVSGTMFPTLGGALAMNIHGKNAFRVGTIGEQVTEIQVLFPTGAIRRLTPEDELFYAVISSAGLLGAIVEVTIQMKRVASGMLDVYAESCAGWDDQFRVFAERRASADYMVSWIDAFGAGRGLFHSAVHAHDPDPSSLRPEAQDLPGRILGLVPKDQVWRVLKHLNGRPAMRALNAAKHRSGAWAGNRKTHAQSLVAFSFLLDYVPGWEKAYRPGGFIQYQCFCPEETAPSLFRELLALQRAERQENYLTVMKRHRPDRFLFSHGVEGFSLAMDLKVPMSGWPAVERLCHRMNDLVLAAGGRFYFAKDSTLRPSDVQAYLGAATVAQYRALKAEYDPHHGLNSELARRTGLDLA